MSKILGDSTVSAEALQQMRERSQPGQKWACYQNVALDSANLGHLKFLKVGTGCTFETAPSPRLPDTPDSINWAYQFVGFADLETGKIVEAQP